MEELIFFPILIINLSIILTLGIVLYYFAKYRLRSILPFILAFSAHSFAMFQFILFEILTGPDFVILRQLYAKVGFVLVMVATLSLFEGIRRIGGYQQLKVDSFLALLLVFLTGLILPYLNFAWVDHEWVLVDTNPFLVVTYMVLLVYFVARITMFVYLQVYNNTLMEVQDRVMIMTGIALFVFGGGLVPVEFVSDVESTLTWSLMIVAIGTVIFTYYYLKHPPFLSISSLGLEMLLISNKVNGNPVFAYNDIPDKYAYGSTLYSGWLKGILDVFAEITHDSTVQKLEFDDLYVIYYENKLFHAFIFSSYNSAFLTDFLKAITDSLIEFDVCTLQSLTNEESKEMINQLFKRTLVI